MGLELEQIVPLPVGPGAAVERVRAARFGPSRHEPRKWSDCSLGMSERPTPSTPPQEDDLQVVERARTKRPRRYQVVLHNDDYTTMEFVVEVLMRFFRKDITEARHIMLHVHHKGYGVVDTFPRDVAETKAEQVMDFAKENGHPLRCTAEPEADDGPDE